MKGMPGDNRQKLWWRGGCYGGGEGCGRAAGSMPPPASARRMPPLVRVRSTPKRRLPRRKKKKAPKFKSPGSQVMAASFVLLRAVGSTRCGGKPSSKQTGCSRAKAA